MAFSASRSEVAFSIAASIAEISVESPPNFFSKLSNVSCELFDICLQTLRLFSLSITSLLVGAHLCIAESLLLSISVGLFHEFSYHVLDHFFHFFERIGTYLDSKQHQGTALHILGPLPKKAGGCCLNILEAVLRAHKLHQGYCTLCK